MTLSHLTPNFILFFICLIPPNIEAQPHRNDSILRIVKTSDFEFSGNGDNSNWDKTNWITLSKNGNGVDYKTQVKVMYSDSGIYCLYKCEDLRITATLIGDFLDIFNEDVVEAFFWTDESIPVYFEYELSPLNYELPILVPNFKGDFLGWRPWHYEASRKTRHAVHIYQVANKGSSINGWTAEFFIPFTLLRPLTNVPARKGSTWRANFYRIDYDNGSTHWYWQPVRRTFHEFDKFGIIIFD
jgi:hypothetical protein